MSAVATPITDPDDPRIELFRDVRDRDLRSRAGLFMAESERVLRRVLARPDRVEAVLLSRTRHEALAAALADLPPRVPVYVADLDVITRIAGFPVHRGVLAAVRRPPPEELTIDHVVGPIRRRERVTLVIAEGLTNVDNMGALFRNAAAFGADGVILDPSCCDPLYRKALRTSAGHALAVPWAIADRWPEDLDRLRGWGIGLVAAETGPDAEPVWTLPPAGRLGIVLGGEATGLSPAAVARCDGVRAIPMHPGVPSINVAVASAVFLYERARSRAGPGSIGAISEAGCMIGPGRSFDAGPEGGLE